MEESISEIYNGLVTLMKCHASHNIVVQQLDIGVIPAFIHSDKQEIISKLTMEFNRKLGVAVAQFKKSYPQVNIKLFPLDTLFHDIRLDYKEKGYDMEKPCLSAVADPFRSSFTFKVDF